MLLRAENLLVVFFLESKKVLSFCVCSWLDYGVPRSGTTERLISNKLAPRTYNDKIIFSLALVLQKKTHKHLITPRVSCREWNSGTEVLYNGNKITRTISIYPVAKAFPPQNRFPKIPLRSPLQHISGSKIRHSLSIRGFDTKYDVFEKWDFKKKGLQCLAFVCFSHMPCLKEWCQKGAEPPSQEVELSSKFWLLRNGEQGKGGGFFPV